LNIDYLNFVFVSDFDIRYLEFAFFRVFRVFRVFRGGIFLICVSFFFCASFSCYVTNVSSIFLLRKITQAITGVPISEVTAFRGNTI